MGADKHMTQVRTYCPYHNQDEDIWCGPAVVMMILRHLRIEHTDLKQEEVIDMILREATWDDWVTDPPALEKVLTQGSRRVEFRARMAVSFEEALQNILASLQTDVPPAVLIWGCLHWAVVEGLVLEGDTTSSDGYSVTDVFLHNPVHHVPDDPPDHLDTNDCCGTGPGCGTESLKIYASTFRDFWMRGWNNKWITIGAGDPESISLPSSVRQIPAERMVRLGGREIEAEIAARSARWRELSKETLRAPVSAGDLLLVRRIDAVPHASREFGLVPWYRGGSVVGVSMIELESGRVGAVFTYRRPLSEFGLENDAVLRLFREKTEWKGDGLEVFEHLVWQPCPESFSPDLPFYQVLSRGGVVGFVRLDGYVFESLTTEGCGI